MWQQVHEAKETVNGINSLARQVAGGCIEQVSGALCEQQGERKHKKCTESAGQMHILNKGSAWHQEGHARALIEVAKSQSPLHGSRFQI